MKRQFFSEFDTWFYKMSFGILWKMSYGKSTENYIVLTKVGRLEKINCTIGFRLVYIIDQTIGQRNVAQRKQCDNRIKS